MAVITVVAVQSILLCQHCNEGDEDFVTGGAAEMTSYNDYCYRFLPTDQLWLAGKLASIILSGTL